MSMTWLKLHHDIIHDIKLRRFTPQEKWAWVTLLVLASENSDRGSIEADDEDLADVCEFNSTQDWLYFKDKLRTKGMIEQVPSGVKIANWGKRQHSSPSDNPEATRERKRKQRAKQKPEPTNPEPSRHEVVTKLSRSCHEVVTRQIQIQIQNTDPDLTSKQIITYPDLCTAEPRICTGEGVVFEGQENKSGLTLVETSPNQPPLHSPPQGSAAPPQDGLDLIFEIYNQDRPEHWAACKVFNEKRRKTVRAFLKEHKDRSVEVFQAALHFAASDPFWADPKKKFDFDTLFEKNRAVQFAERWEGGTGETREQRGERLAREAVQELMQERGYGFKAS